MAKSEKAPIPRPQRIAFLSAWKEDGDFLNAVAVSGLTQQQCLQIIREKEAAGMVSLPQLLAEGVAVDLKGSDGRPVHVITHISDLMRSPAMIHTIEAHVANLLKAHIDIVTTALTNEGAKTANPRDFAQLLKENAEATGGILLGVVGQQPAAGSGQPVRPAATPGLDTGNVQAGNDPRPGESWSIEHQEQDTPAY